MATRALARVNLAAVERNVRRLRRELTGPTGLCAVVKADGYGHGAAPVAGAALAGGASLLAVATAVEAAALREAGLDARVIVLGALSAEELPAALAAGAEVVAWSEGFVRQVAALASGAAGAPGALPVHVKLDTGMGRLGTRDPAEALRIAEAVSSAPGLELAGIMTHFASADEDPAFTREQLGRFAAFVGAVRERWPGISVSAANSAATLREPESRFDFVRCGIAIYGCDPMNQDPARFELEPALELRSYVAAVKLARPGESAGYGRRFITPRETLIATLPIGYGDGVRRALSNNCDVLIEGRRYPLVGTVSMDNITVDLGPDAGVRPGAEAVLVGCSGSERQTVEDLARSIDTINYEILCGISARVPRGYHRDGAPAEEVPALGAPA